MTQKIFIRKLNHLGQECAHYWGEVLSCDAHQVTVKANWTWSDWNTDFGVVIATGDFLIEQFFFDRWYNIMALYTPIPPPLNENDTFLQSTLQTSLSNSYDTDKYRAMLKGWYINVTRPTKMYPSFDVSFGAERVLEWTDLKLDVWMNPDGQTVTLDQDEFEAAKSEMSETDVLGAQAALPQIEHEMREQWRDYTNAQIAQRLAKRGWTIATAESCTGGLIGDTLTNRSGCSAYFMGGVLSYDNRIKRDVLGVREATLSEHGAVSEQCALEMARGVRKAMQVEVGISATGVAGPGGGSDAKPVGLVYLGISTPHGEAVERHVWPHDRLGNKRASADAALKLILGMSE
ncbi:MAG: nicotinamide-nucleotide amidohydrolase family protein [Anaerolineae bacterium]|nr:nicotinamide-nucleotide amidohydrolase family protein [Anaerolineae bacterium]